MVSSKDWSGLTRSMVSGKDWSGLTRSVVSSKDWSTLTSVQHDYINMDSSNTFYFPTKIPLYFFQRFILSPNLLEDSTQILRIVFRSVH